MKKLAIVLSIFLAIGFLYPAQAQNININVNINVDKQPAWGPSGYDYAGYYYFPDLNIYYDVTNTLFYYLSGSKWISNQYLPDKYRKYDLYGLYKVVLNDNQPWQQNKTHKKSYSQYKEDKTQVPIRYSNDSKYSDSKYNNKNWVNTNRNNNNNSNSSNNNKNSNSNKNSSNNNNTNNKDNKDNKNNTRDNGNSGRANSNNNRR